MPAAHLKEYLAANGVEFETLLHHRAFTAQEVADAAHISGTEVAKTVLVKLDGELAMVVLPASEWVDLKLLHRITGRQVELAHESEFRDRFPDCEVGAMPPFGNLYGMDVFVSTDLTYNERIAFNAGSLRELIRIPYRDFERLVEPRVLQLALER